MSAQTTRVSTQVGSQAEAACGENHIVGSPRRTKARP